MTRLHHSALLLVTLALGFLCGCEGDTGLSGDANTEKPERLYAGLKQQKIAVMVWADLRIRAEYNQLPLDLARLVQNELANMSVPEEDRDNEKKNKPTVEFIDAASVARFQREHPEIDGAPIVDVAPRLGASRVVYIEVEEFAAQSPNSIMILQGTAKVTLRIVEVANSSGPLAGRQATIAFEEANIKAKFPPKDPAGVVETEKVTLRVIYRGTLRQLAEKIAARFGE